MKHNKLFVPLLAFVALVALSLACTLSAGPPAIGEVTMAKDLDASYKPVNPTTAFTSDDTKICVSVEVNNLVVGSVVDVKYKLNGEPYETTTSTADKAGSGYYGFTLTVENGLMPGDYIVEVYLDGVLAKTVTFDVVASGPPSIGEVVPAKNVDEGYKPVEPTTVFAPTDTVYISVQVKNLIVGSTVTIKYLLNGEDANADTTLTADKAGSGYYGFSLTPPADGFPVGNYTAEIYLDNALVTSVNFTVQ